MLYKKETAVCITASGRPVINVGIKLGSWKTDVLTSQMDGFKHSELSHFALLTSLQHKKSKKERQLLRDCFHPQVKSKKEVAWPTNLGICRAGNLGRPNGWDG